MKLKLILLAIFLMLAFTLAGCSRFRNANGGNAPVQPSATAAQSQIIDNSPTPALATVGNTPEPTQTPAPTQKADEQKPTATLAAPTTAADNQALNQAVNDLNDAINSLNKSLDSTDTMDDVK